VAVKQTGKIGAGKAGPGRPKGVPNKATASIKKAFLEAFERRGGVKALVEWAEDEPTEFYKLAAKLIPTEITGANGSPLGVVILPAVKS
jgi:hypothetical protein